MSILRRNQSEDNKNLVKREPETMRWMRDMLNWDPFGPQAAVPSLFEPTEVLTFSPAFEVKETKDSFRFSADLPGMKEKDVDVKLIGNRLAISGKREIEREDKEDTYYTYERTYGSFQRTFVLPEGLDTDHIHAEMKDGVLSIALPKLAAAKTKQIAIKSGEQTKS